MNNTLSKREQVALQFAAVALQEILSCAGRTLDNGGDTDDLGAQVSRSLPRIFSASFRYADAFIEEMQRQSSTCLAACQQESAPTNTDPQD